MGACEVLRVVAVDMCRLVGCTVLVGLAVK